MSGFMEEWEKAEDRMSDSALALLDNVTEKDRGLLLHWLLTECDLPAAALAVPSFLAVTHVACANRAVALTALARTQLIRKGSGSAVF